MFSNNIHLLSFEDIIFPSILVIIPAALIWILLGFGLKNYKKSGLIVSLGLVLFFTYGHIFNLLDSSFDYTVDIRHRYVLIPFLALLAIGIFYFIKTRRKLDNATIIVNVIAISLIVISSVEIGTYALEQANLSNINLESEKSSLDIGVTDIKRDIYYIILDGYAGSPILKEIFNYDNNEFLTDLSERGFYVVPNAQANYPRTYFSLPSSLNMEYVNYVGELAEYRDDSLHVLFKLVDNNKVMNTLKTNGYTIVNFNSQFEPTITIDIADLNLCTQFEFLNSELLIMITRTSMLNPVYVNLFTTLTMENRLCVLSELPEVQHRVDGPMFVFAHLVIPHPPYLFGPNGESITEIDDLDFNTWTNKKGYIDQLKFTNKKILEIVDRILAEAEISPIIIIQGDHGTRSTGGDDDEIKQIRERMSILNAYYFPENKDTLLYETITPVNSFRIVFNAYFDANLELKEDRNYFQTPEGRYYLRDVTDILANQ